MQSTGSRDDKKGCLLFGACAGSEQTFRRSATNHMIESTTHYVIGSTIYGAPVTLTSTRGSTGEKQWVLTKEPANPRDDTQVIAGITDEQIEAMGQALALKRRQHSR